MFLLQHRMHLDNIRMRYYCKSDVIAPRWKCNRCNTRMTQLSGEFGGWPTHAFKSLSKEQKQQFYAGAITKNGKDDLKAFADDFMRSYERHEDTYSEGGAYLPLGVWAHNGWSTEAIAAKSKP